MGRSYCSFYRDNQGKLKSNKEDFSVNSWGTEYWARVFYHLNIPVIMPWWTKHFTPYENYRGEFPFYYFGEYLISAQNGLRNLTKEKALEVCTIACEEIGDKREDAPSFLSEMLLNDIVPMFTNDKTVAVAADLDDDYSHNDSIDKLSDMERLEKYIDGTRNGWE